MNRIKWIVDRCQQQLPLHRIHFDFQVNKSSREIVALTALLWMESLRPKVVISTKSREWDDL